MITNVDRVPGYNNRVFLRVRFKSTMANQKTGFVRFVIPTQSFVRNGFPRTETWGPALQRTDAMADGYFRVEKGSCKRATVDRFLSHSSNVSKKWIDIKFDCQPGKAFSLLWYPTSIWWDMDGTTSSDEPWTFPVRTRFKRDDRWTSRPGPTVTVAASPIFITPPNLWYEAPKQVFAVEDVPATASEPAYLKFDGYLDLKTTPVKVELHLTDPISETGEPVLVVQPNLLSVQRSIVVSPCVPGDPLGFDCATAPKGFVELDFPLAGTFTDTNGNVLTSSASVFARVIFEEYTTNGYAKTQQMCGYYGGGFTWGNTVLTGTYWSCAWERNKGAAYEKSARDGVGKLESAEHCPTNTVVDTTHVAFYRIIRCIR